MGNPAYDARRAAEQSEYEKRQAEAEASRAALEALTAFMTGKAQIVATPPHPNVAVSAWSIRLVRDPS